MKKILFLMMLTLSTAIASQAQITFISSIDGTTTDTLTNAGSLNFTSPVNALNNRGGNYTIQFTSLNLSGTSTFKAILQGTIDGTNWANVHGVAGTNGIECDTLQVTGGVPASFFFRAQGNETTNAGKVKRLRIRVVGAGTQSTLIGKVEAFVE